MATSEVQECLKNMSAGELAQTQNAILLATECNPVERVAAMELVSQEVALRQTEGLDRKAERLWNRQATASGTVYTSRIPARERSRLPGSQHRRPAVKPTGRTIHTDARPRRYVSPGPPRKTNPLNAADIVASPVTKSPTRWPAMKKSRSLRVRAAALTPMARTSNR